MDEDLDRPRLPSDLGMAVARAKVDPGLPRTAVLTALRGAIADRGVYIDWELDRRGWVVWLLAQDLERALGWRLVWMMRDESAGGTVAWRRRRLPRLAISRYPSIMTYG